MGISSGACSEAVRMSQTHAPITMANAAITHGQSVFQPLDFPILLIGLEVRRVGSDDFERTCR